MKKFNIILLATLTLISLAACEMTNSYKCQCDDPEADTPGTLQTTVDAKNSSEALEECQAEFPDAECKVSEE